MLHSQDQAPLGAARKYFKSGELTLSYLDFGGNSPRILLMLHGHMGDAGTFAPFAAKMTGWRIIGLDQRGHGWSEHPPDKDYSREAYLQDIAAFIREELGGQPVTLLGHSLGGVNAYQFAARYPELVHAVIVEDIGVKLGGDLSFIEQLPDRSSTLQELRESLKRAGVRAIDYFTESAFEDENGWGFRFDIKGMSLSQQQINGDWWDDWLSSTCPVLLLHGTKSFALTLSQAELMVSRRPNTRLVVFEGIGHGIHTEDLDGFYKAVKEFLGELDR